MSIVHCDYCNKNIDTDYNAEHFIDSTEKCIIEYADEICPECEEHRPDDERVKTGMKCSFCTY